MFETVEEAVYLVGAFLFLATMGVALAVTLRQGWLAEQQAGLTKSRTSSKIIVSMAGLVVVVLGFIVLALFYWLQHDPTELSAAQATFEAAVAQSAGGQRFGEAAEELLQAGRLRRVEVRAVRFQAYRRELFSSDAKSAVGGWRGRLRWDERRQPEFAWQERSCSPVWVVLTTSGRWQLDGGRRCQFA